MKLHIPHISYLLLSVFISLGAMQARGERTWLISSPDQLIVSDNEATRGNLIDHDTSTSWISANGRDNGFGPQYIIVDLKEELSIGTEEDIVVYIRRHTGNDTAHPTAFRIEASNDMTGWEELAHAYFLFRGQKTEEYSARINPSDKNGFSLANGFRYLKFTVTANNSRSRNTINENRWMEMAEFNILRLGRNDNYSDLRIDRHHLVTDYYPLYENYKVTPTMGILDPANHDNENWNTGGFDSNGQWTLDPGYWHPEDPALAPRFQMPDYGFITHNNDRHQMVDENGGVRQNTHITVHDLYAVRGDVIALYPYYSMPSTGNYQENFSHWYDYKTGGGSEYLDFLIDPALVMPINVEANSNKKEFVAGTGMPTNFVTISSVDDYINFANRVNAGEETLGAYMISSLDFEGRTDIPMIGTYEHPYRGRFSGNGRYVTNLVINKPDEDRVGIFGTVGPGAIIRGLFMYSTCSFTGRNFVGMIGAIVPKDGVDNTRVWINTCGGDPTVNAKGINAGGIIGAVLDSGSNPVTVHIEECSFLGNLIGEGNGYSGNGESALLAGWLGYSPDSYIKDSYAFWGREGKRFEGIQGNLSIARLGNSAQKFDNVWCNYPDGQGIYFTETQDPDLLKALGDHWYLQWGYPIVYVDRTLHETRWYGTVGTFFVPREIYSEDGDMQPLPEKEYLIAADFSQSFASWRNIKSNEIIEPVINFRHVFRIRDGKEFADNNMSTYERNRNYIRLNRRNVSARAGAPFQIRFDSPVPAQQATRSKWYYKVNSRDYRRICTMEIRVYDADTDEELSRDNSMFYPSEEFNGEGSRQIHGVNYNLCGGGGSYYRMLRCNAEYAQPGKRYKVRLIAKDVNGEYIRFGKENDPRHPDEELWVQEYYISFYEEANASLLTDEQLKDEKFRNRRPENLHLLGELMDQINYDQYADLLADKETAGDNAKVENSANYLDISQSSGSYFRWPLPAAAVDYAFGYDQRHDFNEYMIADNSARTPYNAANANLEDRLSHDTNGEKKGFFFYVNAAADPGNMASLRLKNFCTGSTVHVSAWISEMSLVEEVANVAFNFIAVMNDSTRVPIHTFVSGYVPTDRRGTWHQVYYSFVPNLSGISNSADINHFELVLENNCKSSNGADYAIDDIRVYVTTPKVYATQLRPVCQKETVAPVRIDLPYDVLISSMGLDEPESVEGNQNIRLYYTFLDKKMFEELYDDETVSDSEAFYRSVLHFSYRGNHETQDYGILNLNSHFMSNPSYDEYGENDFTGDIAYRGADGNVRLIVFNASPSGDGLRPGKEYIVAIWTATESDEVPADGPGPEQFKVWDGCSKVSILSVSAASKITIDGEIVDNNNPIEVCANQSPAVQISLMGMVRDENGDIIKDENGNPVIEVVENNAAFDWYMGSYEEFMNESRNIDGTTITLYEAILQMRQFYTNGGLSIDEIRPVNNFTEDMYQYVRSFVYPESGKPKLKLGGNSFAFPPVTIPEGETEGEAFVLAVPMMAETANYVICTAPTEVKIVVRNHAPTMQHGFADITYPEVITDVPIRIGYKMLKHITATGNRLIIPVHRIQPVTQGIKKMDIDISAIHLVETDDPEYKDIRGENAPLQTLLAVGVLKDMKAVQGEENTSKLEVELLDNFRYKEGYYYRLRYSFKEENNDCNGQDIFTIKVVPEYQRWTGAYSDDWNNDLNWTRVSSTELMRSHNGNDAHTTDGANETPASFVPMDFTKTIVSYPVNDGVENAADYCNVPQLKEDIDSDLLTLQYIGNKTYKWSKGDKEGMTPLIQYDMASATLPDLGNNVVCRPWLANECDQIHFNNDAWIGSQQHLNYNRAWVDIELEPSRWHMMSSPLAGTVAGDMYMPHDNARQETELFSEISYTPGVNNRFAPAVYQRSWNKATANVYEIDKATPQNVIVETRWSHVYNDVNEGYLFGNGFSIKADVSEVSDRTDTPSMRLPKHDTHYDYYSHDGNTIGHNTKVRDSQQYKLNDASADKTVRLECDPRNPGRYFLAGNPYMCYMDMSGFLKRNSSVITGKYWILDEKGQKAVVYNPDTDTFVCNYVGDEEDKAFTDNSIRYMPPTQGFFVETVIDPYELVKNDPNAHVDSFVELTYSPADMAGTLPAAETAAGQNTNAMHITLESENGHRSQAVMLFSESASTGYDPAEDAAMLWNPDYESLSHVYTLAGNVAATVNATAAAEGTEIGIRAPEDSRQWIRFSNVDCMGSEMMLYDASTDTYTPIEEDMEYEVKGRAVARLFIVKSKMDLSNSDITIRADGQNITVVSGTEDGNLSIRAYDLMGRTLKSLENCGQTATFSLDTNFCIIEANDGYSSATKKLMLK